jgi:hypothetical protein
MAAPVPEIMDNLDTLYTEQYERFSASLHLTNIIISMCYSVIPFSQFITHYILTPQQSHYFSLTTLVKSSKYHTITVTEVLQQNEQIYECGITRLQLNIQNSEV